MRFIILYISLVLVTIFSAEAQSLPVGGVKRIAKPKPAFYEYCLDSSAKVPLYLFLTDRRSAVGTTSRQVPRHGSVLIREYIPAAKRPSLIQVHGNILYDLNYRSFTDTPFSQKDVQQHTIQTWLDITVKDNYPLRLYFTTRLSNSYFFKDFYDLNLGFDPARFQANLREKIRNSLQSHAPDLDRLNSLKAELEAKMKKLRLLEMWMNDPAWQQKLVEQREAAFRQQRNAKINLPDSLIDKAKALGDTLLLNRLPTRPDAHLPKPGGNTSLNKVNASVDDLAIEYRKRKAEIDSLRAATEKFRKVYEQTKSVTNQNNLEALSELNNAGNTKSVLKLLRKHHIADSSLPKGYKMLLGIQNLAIGRSIVNYSELSVKNISITGLQVAYHPSYYIAFASGFVDYRYRDYIVNSSPRQRGYLNAVRIGRGDPRKNNIILTWYSGRRQQYNYPSGNGGATGSVSPAIMGFTIEGKWRLNQNHVVTAEFAKSSMPSFVREGAKTGFAAGMFSMKDHSNEAYSLKINSYIPITKTRVEAYYKKLGENFQSFSFLNSSSRQQLWSIKMEQPLFKQTLKLTGSIRTNDFNNPFISTSYKSSTIFKSIQATYRKRKWPVMSVGYYPSSQLTRLSDNYYTENLFYTLVGNVNHFFKLGTVQANTALVYTRFYNQSSDSNFIYYNSVNYLLGQSIFAEKFTYTLNLSNAVNPQYSLYVIDGNVQYKLSGNFSLGGGLKYNRQSFYNRQQLGYSCNTTFRIPKLGQFQFFLDKSFIPGNNRQLVENNAGHFTYLKTF